MEFRSLRFRKFNLGGKSNPLAQKQTSQEETSVQPQLQQRPVKTPLPQVDDDSKPQTEAEARTHIAKIRAEKGLHGPDSNIADLQAALVVLSAQLYQKSTHFLLELVQNADDNSYDVSTPELVITYENRTLCIDCNEIGFTRKNVAAISRIGRSSKSGLDHSRRYIGEKGIGFKSVFKVSDVVWIRSGHYSFKFDKSQRLGMIAPIWSEFPRQTTQGVTSILMKLSEACDVTELINEIKALDPRLLIYLQRLKRIKITVHEGGNSSWETALERRDQAIGFDGQQLVTLHHGLSLLSYKIFRLRVKELPYDPKRAEYTESELVLAFPVSETHKPMIESQNVYAFLPIRDYGFKFLLQADFLLIASREDIDSSSQWNTALLDRIPHALHGAIIEFNSGELRYSWLPYLPFRQYVADFFKGLEEATVRLLCTSPILESFAGEWRPPTTLTYVPEPFTDKEGKPLVLTQSTMSRYLSHKYPSAECDRLSKLGVKPLSTEGFIDDVRKFILRHPNEFRSMPDTWHSRLAEALMTSLVRSIYWKSTISAMEIVPLRDGRWASMNQGKFLFPAHSSPLVIPKGIDVFEIHPSADTDYHRRHLFATLGANEFEAKQICDIIIRTHERPDFVPGVLASNDLISHITFLYKAGWKNADRRDIWFVTETGSYCHGSQIYINSDVPYSAQSIFEQDRLKVPFLHPDYYTIFSTLTLLPEMSSKAADWQEWLVEQMNVAQIPRLANPSIGAPFSLSKDFQFILDTYPSTDLLLLIRHHWRYYSKWIMDKGRDEMKAVRRVSQQKLREKISSMNVKCRRGIVSPLNKSFLPLSSMQLESFISVPFLDVPEPDNDEWDFLRHFGVIVELDASFFIECLRRLKDAPADMKRVSQLYGQIDCWATRDNADGIKRSFEMNKLVLIPDEKSENGGEWVGIDGCVWSGPACLRTTPCLEKHYPEHQSLLQNTLRVGDADIKTLVSEARNILATDGINHIAQVFTTISKYLEVANASTVVLSLTECRIFPVVTRKLCSGFDSLHTAAETDMWFVADRTYLKDSLEGIVPLLAFDSAIVEQISPLINTLGLEYRLLSTAAKGVSKTKGKTDLHLGYTKTLRKRARCIARLVPKDSPNRVTILRQLHKIEVYQSEKVIVEWVVTSLSGETFHGRADSGRVASRSEKQGLKIFLTAEDINVHLPPLELQEEIARFGEIKDPKHFTLLLYLLMQDDLKSIEDTFHRRGIPNDVPEFDSIDDIDDNEKLQPKPKSKSRPKNWISQVKFRRKACPDGDASMELEAFIKRVEKIKIVQERIDNPWGGSDVAFLFSRICRLEKRDATSLLPQDPKSSRTFGDNLGSLLDLKTGIWKELMTKDEYLKTRDTNTFDGLSFTSVKPVLDVDEETHYIGELYVSNFLENQLGEAYVPSRHWTSQLRRKSGRVPYECPQEGSSTFTFIDHGDAFTKLLSRFGYLSAASWIRSPVYHIKVVVSKEGLLSAFSLDPLQVKKAQDCSLLGDKLANPSEVFILISVYNILTDPGMALFVDPWHLHLTKSLELKVYSPYRASFTDVKSAIFLHGSCGVSSSLGKGVGINMHISSTRAKNGADQQNPSKGIVKDRIFTYRPLRNHREIRLLELFPGKDDMPLEGTVHHVSMDSPGQYSAISYVWGVALKPFHFQTSEGNIPITVSLHDALRCIRDKEVSTLLWVDAICIDQEVTHEKSTQIRLMRTIFQSAESVIAWLGNEKDNSDHAIETLMQIRMIALKPDSWPEGLPAIPVSWGGRNTPSPTDIAWKEIGLLLSREWFRRSWIVQELILASNVTIVCGGWHLNWEDFFEAVTICREAMRLEEARPNGEQAFVHHSGPAYALGLTRQSRLTLNDFIFGRRYNLLELMDLFSYTKATRKRDKLFSLLGLARDCSETAFDPDYDSSLEAVVRRYASEFVRRGQAMDLLYKAGTSKSYPFCSWIPFWTREDFPRTISTWRGAGENFCAGGKRPPRAHLLPAMPSTLVVRGTPFDTILCVSDTKMDKVDIVAFVNSIRLSIDSHKPVSIGESRHELKLKLPIGGASCPLSEPKNYLQAITDAESNRENWPLDLGDKIPIVGTIQEFVNFVKAPKDSRDVCWKYWETAAAFAKRLSNGMFCVTKRHYAGMVPGDAQAGDEVCIFTGGNVPFVLRKDESQKEKIVYRLVGEAYIHGFMHGEALSFKHISEEDFLLV